MAPRPMPKRPSPSEFRDMLAGPRVDIYVGPAKKHYVLPKLLLCYYSPFFDKCFNGPFKEGHTQKLELPEDRVEFFEIMIEFMLHGKVENLSQLHEFNGNETDKQDKKEFLDLFRYNEKYGLGEISNEAHDEFASIMSCYLTVEDGDIETVFGALPAGSPLMSTFVESLLWQMGFQDLGEFGKQEVEVEGYAAEVLDYIRTNFEVSLKRRKSAR